MIKLIYLSEHTMEVIKENRALETHSCHFFFKLPELIFICDFFTLQIFAFQSSENVCFKIFKGRRKYKLADRIRENYSINNYHQKDFIKEKIYLCHCRGHDSIYIAFVFEGFYENQVRLLSRNYWCR